jgi:hypothetical protein
MCPRRWDAAFLDFALLAVGYRRAQAAQ